MISKDYLLNMKDLFRFGNLNDITKHWLDYETVCHSWWPYRLGVIISHLRLCGHLCYRKSPNNCHWQVTSVFAHMCIHLGTLFSKQPHYNAKLATVLLSSTQRTKNNNKIRKICVCRKYKGFKQQINHYKPWKFVPFLENYIIL